MSSPGPRADATSAKTERLMNLTLVLLSQRRGLHKDELRARVPQYAESASVEAFERMFERDKDELRELGVPLRMDSVDAYHDDDLVYRIDPDEYALPDIAFDPDELAVLALAARAWSDGSLSRPADQALRKLRATDEGGVPDVLSAIQPRLRIDEPAFEVVKRAVVEQRRLGFEYRRPGESNPGLRTIEPWALTSWQGRWYVSGFDVDRGEPRLFRLSRMVGAPKLQGRAGAFEPPSDHDPRAMLERRTGSGTPTPTMIRVADGAAHGLRRRGEAVDGAPIGWQSLRVMVTDVDHFADELASYGPSVVALEPADLVDAVRARLARIAAAHTPGDMS